MKTELFKPENSKNNTNTTTANNITKTSKSTKPKGLTINTNLNNYNTNNDTTNTNNYANTSSSINTNISTKPITSTNSTIKIANSIYTNKINNINTTTSSFNTSSNTKKTFPKTTKSNTNPRLSPFLDKSTISSNTKFSDERDYKEIESLINTAIDKEVSPNISIKPNNESSMISMDGWIGNNSNDDSRVFYEKFYEINDTKTIKKKSQISAKKSSLRINTHKKEDYLQDDVDENVADVKNHDIKKLICQQEIKSNNINTMNNLNYNNNINNFSHLNNNQNTNINSIKQHN